MMSAKEFILTFFGNITTTSLGPIFGPDLHIPINIFDNQRAKARYKKRILSGFPVAITVKVTNLKKNKPGIGKKNQLQKYLNKLKEKYEF